MWKHRLDGGTTGEPCQRISLSQQAKAGFSAGDCSTIYIQFEKATWDNHMSTIILLTGGNPTDQRRDGSKDFNCKVNVNTDFLCIVQDIDSDWR
jgi:hypothetical protein